jgi:hypothetical protein
MVETYKKDILSSFKIRRISRPASFQAQMSRRCFNCFSYYHRVAQCRDSTRCWVCKKWRHSFAGCPRKRVLGNDLPPPTLPFSPANALASSSVCPSHASSSSVRLSTNQQAPMDNRRALGERSRSHSRPRWEPDGRIMGNAINFSGNPRFSPTIAFKSAATSPEMDERTMMLSNYALRILEKGALGVESYEELKVIVSHHFGFSKHELLVYRSHADPFIIIFSNRSARDLVFAAGRLIDGQVELCFEAWDLDGFRDRTMLPYHVRLIIEGIPHHAWSQDIADRVLCDEALIHRVQECSR